jgi:hypothetical protein
MTQTPAFILETYHGDIGRSEHVARWAIEHMQDLAGYFYLRKHRFMTNRTPCLHWRQSTMLAALASPLQR